MFKAELCLGCVSLLAFKPNFGLIFVYLKSISVLLIKVDRPLRPLFYVL